jgi:hypothetical protein
MICPISRCQHEGLLRFRILCTTGIEEDTFLTENDYWADCNYQLWINCILGHLITLGKWHAQLAALQERGRHGILSFQIFSINYDNLKDLSLLLITIANGWKWNEMGHCLNHLNWSGNWVNVRVADIIHGMQNMDFAMILGLIQSQHWVLNPMTLNRVNKFILRLNLLPGIWITWDSWRPLES